MREMVAAIALMMGATSHAEEVDTCPVGASTFVGVYRENFEVQAFQPDGIDAIWWVAYSEDIREQFQSLAPNALGPDRAFALNVELVGVVAGNGDFGMMGAYPCQLTVTRIVSAEPANR
jgi:hypothetical protein